MKLALSSTISEIDKYLVNKKEIPMCELIDRSGRAVANFVRYRVPKGKSVLILAGKGNNGADGYSTALMLMDEYDVLVYDVFSEGQKSEWGKKLCEEYKNRGGRLEGYTPCEKTKSLIKSCDCIIDAVFGTGFTGEAPKIIVSLAIAVREAVGAYKIAVDVPLGINADNGSVSDFAISVDATVVLSFVKPGIVSYPAKFYVGEIVFDDIGIDEQEISDRFEFRYRLIDTSWVKRNLPKRPENSHKGTFGKMLVITGSEKYQGAAHLSLEAALRGGVGLVSYIGTRSLSSKLADKFPEVIYNTVKSLSVISDKKIGEIVEQSKKFNSVLIGSGSDNTEGILKLTLALLASEGGTLVIDADAINALAGIGEAGIMAIRNSKRKVVLTPHPLELARLISSDVSNMQLNRLAVAEKFAKENNCILVLKGAGTIVTNGYDVYINAVASSSLAKAGSGDVLAGLMASLLANKEIPLIKAVSLAVYFHSIAGVSLADEYSAYGVTPSDMPKEIARQISKYN